MILSYLSHKKMVMKNSGIKVIATSSPIVYRDVVQCFQGKKDMLLSSDDDYNQLNIIKDFDFIADPVLNQNIFDKYMPVIIKGYIEGLNEADRNEILKTYHKLEGIIQDSLLLEDLPLELEFNEDLKKFLKIENLHLDTKFLEEPYAIIESILKIHQNYNLHSIPVACNVAHYLNLAQVGMLNDLLKEMKLKLILIEFTSADFLFFPKDVDYFYIDQDLVDWY